MLYFFTLLINVTGFVC